jgi:hypothetical protein
VLNQNVKIESPLNMTRAINIIAKSSHICEINEENKVVWDINKPKAKNNVFSNLSKISNKRLIRRK